MKKHAIAIAVGSLFALPAVALAGGPTVYGKVNVTYEGIEETDKNGITDVDNWQLQSNDSRLGVKGSFDLDARDLTAIYGLEFGVDVDEGDSGGETFKQRNIYGGLQHATMGTFKVGKFDTPFKKAQGDVDQFGDLGGDIKHIAAGENRESNILQYTSPKLGDVVTVNVAFMPGEDDEASDRDGPADSISSSLVFDNGTFYGALAYDSEMGDDTFDAALSPEEGDDYVDAFRAVGMMNMGNFEFGGLVQTAESSEDVGGKTYEDTTTLVSGAYGVDRWKFKAQYGVTDMDQLDDERSLMAIGADYKMGKASKLFAYYSQVEQDETEFEETHLGLGFQHKFSM
ncbi:Outer membrane protein (porin) [Ectothiorhodospira mobilis]|uniref:Outer membrane protein (Porin) n=1 Tax=Ectothiorhodospira mobilis TaxID=195064 RepID=A0A1I4RWR9_ECTMO|nr:porin [Ectothiorhodospira mobilis]SFM56677.1 Outer membrane protein (porin) [Ectothiorhodospira mobilis]